MWRNTQERWGSIAKLLHWLVVVLILAQFVLASIAEDLPLGMEKIATLARHKSVGITILALAVLRVLWRLLNPTPAPPPASRRWERRLAAGVHWGLYAAIFLLPLSGWMMSSARNFPVSWFGLLTLPDLVGADPGIYAAMHEAHEILGTLLLVLAAAHVAGALRHHFLKRDDVLRRMLPLAAVVALLAAGLGPGVLQAGASDALRLDAARSTLRFHFVQAGASTEGRFRRVEGTLRPAATAPAATTPGTLVVGIDIASVDTGDGERDALLRGPDLFDAAKHAQARFEVRRLTAPDAAGRVTLDGALQLRGVTRALRVPARLVVTGSGAARSATLSGSTVIRRLDFGIGRGEWASTQWVGNDVRVEFFFDFRSLP